MMTDEVKFLDAPNARPLARVVTLEYPVGYAGVEYRHIHVVRLTVAEVQAFEAAIKAWKEDDPDYLMRWPLFVTADRVQIPDAVLDALIDDDRFELEKAALDFLPRRYRGAPDSNSPLSNGDSTAPSFDA